MAIAAPAETDRAAGITPSAPWSIQALTLLPAHRLAVRFQDGTQGAADLSAVLNGPECGMSYARFWSTSGD
jgi:hypothetical protein